jgi:hypothetical protein
MSHPSGLPSFLLPYFFTLTLTKLPLEGWVETLIPITNLVFVSTIRPMARGLSLVCSNVWRPSNCTLENFLCSFSNLTCAFLAIITIVAGHKPSLSGDKISIPIMFPIGCRTHLKLVYQKHRKNMPNQTRYSIGCVQRNKVLLWHHECWVAPAFMITYVRHSCLANFWEPGDSIRRGCAATSNMLSVPRVLNCCIDWKT